MAVNEAGPLRFCGPGAKECDEFVATVIKHAYDQGKPRDDVWMADFAATCMAEDALRWWSELDEEIQGSWKLLRRAMFSRYRPLFYGHSGDEAEQFVFSVRRRIWDAGKQKDNDWIITFVSDCFVGKALRWHVSLDSSIRGDWKCLEVAILAQFSRDGQSDPLSNSVPLPAPAMPPPPETKIRGRIRALKKNGTEFLYLSWGAGSAGRLVVTSNLGRAFEVECDPSTSSPQTLFVPDGQIPGCDALGARWKSQATTSTTNIAYICGVSTSGDGDSLDVDEKYSGPKMTSVWKISTKPSDGQHILPITATNGSGSLFACTDGSNAPYFRIGASAAPGHANLDLFFEHI